MTLMMQRGIMKTATKETRLTFRTSAKFSGSTVKQKSKLEHCVWLVWKHELVAAPSYRMGTSSTSWMDMRTHAYVNDTAQPARMTSLQVKLAGPLRWREFVDNRVRHLSTAMASMQEIPLFSGRGSNLNGWVYSKKNENKAFFFCMARCLG